MGAYLGEQTAIAHSPRGPRIFPFDKIGTPPKTNMTIETGDTSYGRFSIVMLVFRGCKVRVEPLKQT